MSHFYPAYKERDFLVMPIRDVWRLANEMFRIQSSEELRSACAASYGSHGGTEYFESLKRRAFGDRGFKEAEESEREMKHRRNKDKNVVSFFQKILQDKKARSRANVS